jgi:hypothetical protein
MPKSDHLVPSAAERGDALDLVKRFAYEGYMKIVSGTEEEFEELWRTAFNVANVEPNPPLSTPLDY